MLSFSSVLGEGNTEHPVTLSPLRVTTCVFIQVNQEKTCLWQHELLRNVHCRDRPPGSAPIICCPLQSQENSQPSQPSHTGSVSPIHSPPPARAQTVCTLYTQPPLPLVWPSVRWPVWEKDVLLLDQGKHSDTCRTVNNTNNTTQWPVHRTMMTWRECCPKWIF